MQRIIDWVNGSSDSFFSNFVAIMVICVLNFVMSIFALYMLVKMSQAKWSIKNNNSEEAK